MSSEKQKKEKGRIKKFIKKYILVYKNEETVTTESKMVGYLLITVLLILTIVVLLV